MEKAARLTRILFLAMVLAVATGSLVFQPPEALAGTIRGTVVTVFDGDTVEVAMEGGRVETVRLRKSPTSHC